jgi:PPOX class probable F420-dependent enzyme
VTRCGSRSRPDRQTSFARLQDGSQRRQTRAVQDADRPRLLAEARVGHLATVSGDGMPHVVPCCFALSDGTIFTAVDAKPKSTAGLQRVRNIEANPNAALIVDRYDEDWSRLWWVRADGTARIVVDERERDRALQLLTAKYAQYREVAIDGPVIAIDITRWRGWSYA